MGRVLSLTTIVAIGIFFLDGCGGGSTTPTTANNPVPTLSSITASPNPVNKGQNVVLTAAASSAPGDTLTYNWTVPSGWTAVSGQGMHQLTLTAPNAYNNSASVSLRVSGNGGSVNGEITVSTAGDPLPTISSVSASPNPVAPSSQQTLTASAFGDHNEAVTYSWTATGGWTIVSGQGTDSITVRAPATYSASGGATITVTNPAGGSVTGQLGLGTTGDPLPTLSSISASSSPVNNGGPLTLTATASGSAGDTLSYAWTPPAGWTITSGQGTSQLHVTAPNAYSQVGSFTLAVGNGNGGSVNGEITVNTASDPVPTLTGITPSGNPVGKAATFTLTASASGAPGDTLGYVWGAPAGWTINSGQGTAVLSVTAPGLYSASGNFTVAVSNGNGGSVNGQIFITTSSDPPPALNSIMASSNPVMKGGTFTVTATASDSPGDALNYTWTVPAGWTITGGQGTAILSVTAPDNYQVSGSITLTVANGNSGSVNGQITVSTTTDPLPTINSVTPTPDPASVGATQTITASASSPSGDALTYTWTVPTGWSIVSGQGTSTLTVTAPQTYGASGDVTITVTNPSGGSVNAVAPVSTGSDVVATVEMAPTAAGAYLTASTGNAGFTLYGDKEQVFTAIAYDANHVPILGPGAPAITVTGTAGVPLTPQPSSPYLWGITNTAFNTLEYVTLTATPATGPAVTAEVPVQTRHIVFYALNALAEFIEVYYDEDQTLTSVILVETVLPTGLAIGDDGTIAIPAGSQGIDLFANNQLFLTLVTGGTTNNLCIDHVGNIYATDNGSGGIEEYSKTGTQIATYTSGMSTPFDCAVDINNGLYVANKGNASIAHYPYESTTPDDSWVVSGGTSNSLESIAVDHVGNVYVGLTDSNNVPHIQVYPRGSHSLAFTLNSYSADANDAPTGMSVDVAGNLWVSSLCTPTPSGLGCGAAAVQVFHAPLTSASVPTNLLHPDLAFSTGGSVAPHQ